MKNLHITNCGLLLLISLSLLFIIACGDKTPNTTVKGNDIFEVLEIEKEVTYSKAHYEDTVYVPIYSDIYINQFNPKSQLAATLSIRNTSIKDTLYISTINYYDTKGDLVRSYIDNPIMLNPMATLDYVIEKEDETGGSGANFLLHLSSKNINIKPIIQAVMVGVDGNKAYAFTVDGYSLKTN